MIEAIIAVVGLAVGIGGKYVYDKQRESSSKHNAEKVLARAETKASDIILKAKDEALVELQKAKETLALLQKEKQEAIQKARKDSVVAVVKNKEQAEVFAKAAALWTGRNP